MSRRMSGGSPDKLPWVSEARVANMSVSADVGRKPGVVVVGERSSRSEHVGLRDVGRKPRQVMEWNEGIEPSPSGWKPGALPVELIPRGVVQSSKDSDRPVTRILRRSTPVAGARVELALRTGYEPGAAPLLRVPRGWLGERSSGSEHVGLRRCRPEMSTSSWLGERSSCREHVGLRRMSTGSVDKQLRHRWDSNPHPSPRQGAAPTN